jgi:hypothetical protein
MIAIRLPPLSWEASRDVGAADIPRNGGVGAAEEPGSAGEQPEPPPWIASPAGGIESVLPYRKFIIFLFYG